MIAKKRTKNDYREMADALLPLGFIQEEPGQFFNEILNRTFDFTAHSLKGIPNVIFSRGVLAGGEDARNQLRQAIGIG